MMKHIKILLFIFSILFLFFSCGKDPVENPCECGQKPVSANFTITETRGFPQWLIEMFEPYDTDTIMFGTTVFTALEEDANYTWLIGTETLHDQVVERSGFPSGQTVPITLIVDKEPDLVCFPNDDGRDTLTRYLYKAESTCESLIHGDFHGAIVSNPQDTFTVSIYTCDPFPLDSQGQLTGGLVLSNLKMDCVMQASDIIITHKQGAFWGMQCDAPVGIIKVSDENYDNIEIKYMPQIGDDKDKELIFKGTKK